MAEGNHGTLRWIDGMRFVAQAGSGHGLVLDAVNRPGHAGASPMELMLISVAGCTAIDVVAILGKMRQPLDQLEVRVAGERAETNPKRFTAITLHYLVRGEGLDEAKVARAVELSHSTYCSAVASLHPDIAIRTEIEIVAPVPA